MLIHLVSIHLSSASHRLFWLMTWQRHDMCRLSQLIITAVFTQQEYLQVLHCINYPTSALKNLKESHIIHLYYASSCICLCCGIFRWLYSWWRFHSGLDHLRVNMNNVESLIVKFIAASTSLILHSALTRTLIFNFVSLWV